MIEFYPLSLAVLLALAAAALSFRHPPLGVLLAFLQVAPAYEYQFSSRFGGAWGVMLVGVMFFLSFYASGLARTGFHRLVGAGAGAVAAYLMATPIYFASVPLLIVLSAWYKNAAKATAVSIYLANYFPLLLLASSWANAGAPLPLFSQVSNLAPRFEAVDLEKISLQILGFGATASGAVRFVDTAASLLSRVYGPVLFISLIVFSVSASHQMGWVVAWLKARDIFPRYLDDYLGILSALAGWAIFIVPLVSLQFALMYSVESFGLLAQSGSLIVLFAGSLTTSWITVFLVKRAQLVRFREEVLSSAGNLRRRIGSILSTIERAEEELAVEGLSELNAPVEALGNKVDLIFESYMGLERKDLEDRLRSLDELSNVASSLDDLMRQKLKEAYDSLFEQYTTALNVLKELGVRDANPQVSAEQLDGKSIDEVLIAYASLLQYIKNVTEELVKTARELSETLRTGFDPEFPEVTAEMASEFLKQGDYTNAIESSVLTTRQAMAKIGPTVSDSLETSKGIALELADLVSTRLTVLAYQLGEDDLVKNLQELTVFSKKFGEIGASGSASDIFSLYRIKKGLPDAIATLVKSIDDALLMIEKNVDAEVPPSFNWNKDLEVHVEVTKLLKTIEDQRGSSGFEFVDSCSSGLELAERLTERFDVYLDTLAFASSYRFVEKMIDAKLAKSRAIAVRDLRVRMAPDFMRLYALNHPNTLFDKRSKKLSQPERKSEREAEIG